MKCLITLVLSDLQFLVLDQRRHIDVGRTVSLAHSVTLDWGVYAAMLAE